MFSEDIQNLEFSYKEEAQEFVCCGTNSKMPKLAKTDCTGLADCLLNRNCMDRTTCVFKPLKTSQKSTCVSYKVEFEKNVSSGLLHCSIDEKIKSFAFFASQSEQGSYSGKYENREDDRYGLYCDTTVS
jgi:hypothetical protein